MSAQRLTMLFAGLFLLTSLLLAHFLGQVDLSVMSWLWFSLFIGINLTIAGATGFCLMTKILKAAGAQ